MVCLRNICINTLNKGDNDDDDDDNNNNNKGGKDEKNETCISLWYGYDSSHRHKNTPKCEREGKRQATTFLIKQNNQSD
jgi:hypothetical protein